MNLFFQKKNEINPSEDKFILNSKVKTFKINDSSSGTVFKESLQLMEFIFYRKKTLSDENALYDEIAQLFYKKFGIDSKLPQKELFEVTIEEIKKIISGTEIKKIFQDAKKKLKIKSIDLQNLNTTALSLLHKKIVFC